MAKAISVSDRIKQNAKAVYDRIIMKQKPTMTTPVRSLSNVKYHSSKGHFEISGKSKKRTLTVSTVKTFAQTLKMMALSKELGPLVARDQQFRSSLRARMAMLHSNLVDLHREYEYRLGRVPNKRLVTFHTPGIGWRRATMGIPASTTSIWGRSDGGANGT
jgi:hypothetical protein